MRNIYKSFREVFLTTRPKSELEHRRTLQAQSRRRHDNAEITVNASHTFGNTTYSLYEGRKRDEETQKCINTSKNKNWEDLPTVFALKIVKVAKTKQIKRRKRRIIWGTAYFVCNFVCSKLGSFTILFRNSKQRKSQTFCALMIKDRVTKLIKVISGGTGAIWDAVFSIILTLEGAMFWYRYIICDMCAWTFCFCQLDNSHLLFLVHRTLKTFIF